jgi:ABC-type lipoprotein release transport system permease subunit
VLLAVFAVMAIAVAAVGLYGVIACSVAQRTSESGVRMALGADARRIRTMVLREGVVVALVGGLVGVAAAYPDILQLSLKRRDSLLILCVLSTTHVRQKVVPCCHRQCLTLLLRLRQFL